NDLNNFRAELSRLQNLEIALEKSLFDALKQKDELEQRNVELRSKNSSLESNIQSLRSASSESFLFILFLSQSELESKGRVDQLTETKLEMSKKIADLEELYKGSEEQQMTLLRQIHNLKNSNSQITEMKNKLEAENQSLEKQFGESTR